MALLVECQFAVDTSGLPELQQFRDWAERALNLAGCLDETRTIGLRIVAEDESRELNRRFRGIDRPTNVLAFPADAEGWPPDEPLPLGELVICAPILDNEAREQSKPVMAHWCHIVVHGTLHLAGFDHAEHFDAEHMESLERSIVGEFGFADPYRETNSAR